MLVPCLFILNVECPQRIISLGPVITEELYILGVEDKLIANTVYCENPPEAKKKEKIGTVIEINLEKIVSLNPDLVIATPLGNPKQIEKIEKLGIKVISFPSPETFKQICEQFIELGKIVGKQKEAEDIVFQAKTAVDSIIKQTPLPKKHIPKVFMEVGTNPLCSVPENSFIHNLIEISGGINIASDSKNGLYSREKVLQNNPDIIIIVTMGMTGEEEKEVWRKYKTINAVKNDKIHILDSYVICSPTPVTFVKAVKELTNIFFPSAEEKTKQ